MAIDIASILGGSLGETVATIIGKFKADPNKVLEMQQAVAENASLLEQKQLELQGKLQDAISSEIQAASANIQAEAKSGNWYTVCARPTFLYIIDACLVYNLIIAPITHGHINDIPAPLVWLFGSVMLGYTGARSWDKYNQAQGDDTTQKTLPIDPAASFLSNLKLGKF